MSHINVIQLRLAPEDPLILLDPQPGMSEREVICQFMADIHEGYAVLTILHNTFSLDFEKEIPDAILNDRIAKHPFNHNRKLIIEP